MSTERFGGSVLINGVPVSMSDEEVDRLLRSGRMTRRTDASKPRDDLMTTLVHRYGFSLEVPFGGLSGAREFRWDAGRVDPATGAKVAVEYSGFGPGHQWNAGLERDQEKITEGQLAGWTVVVCNSGSVNDGRCLRWVETALKGVGPWTS